jgi:hypothetical protein
LTIERVKNAVDVLNVEQSRVARPKHRAIAARELPGMTAVGAPATPGTLLFQIALP